MVDFDNDLIRYFDSKTYKWLWDIHEGVEADGGNGCCYMTYNPRSVIDKLCSSEKWSVWSQDPKNLAQMRLSIGNTYGLRDNKLIYDVLPDVVQKTGDHIEKMGCSFDVAYLAEREVRVHKAHCAKLPKRAAYNTLKRNIHTTRLVKPGKKESSHDDVPYIHGASLSNSRMVLIDTGASFDMINKSLVIGRLPDAIRDLVKPTNINTANGRTRVQVGIRIKMGPLGLYYRCCPNG